MLLACFIRKFHEASYFVVQVISAIKPEMMVVLPGLAGDLCDLFEAKVVFMGFGKGEHHMDEVPTYARDVGNSFPFCCDANHGLRRNGLHFPYPGKFINEVMQ